MSAAPTGSPLRQRTFAVLWVATIAGNIGSFMRDVASAWVVTDLSPSPAAVALIQAAATLPVFLLAIPAGVLSDILDRRRFLIAIQLLLAAVSGTLMLLAHFQALTLPWLLLLTLLGGVGAALMGPTWQSIVPELVPREQLRDAVALNSLGVNVARALGPAAGGLLLGLAGAPVTYGTDVLSYLMVITALLWWRRPAPGPDPMAEQFASALRAGLRYTRASPELHRVLLRAVLFFASASAVWALLPLVARELLRGDASFYGLLLGAVGLGAIAGALMLPRLRARLDSDGLLLAAGLSAAAVLALLALAPPKALALALMALLGMAWIVALTTLGGAAQAILPNWVRGRGLAVYLTVFNGALTLGSLAWGAVAQWSGIPAALLIAAASLAISSMVARAWALPRSEADPLPFVHWPEPPQPAADAEMARGPVIVQIEYRVASANRPAFLHKLQELALVRRRDGASAWGVAEDLERPELLVEWFIVESWAEHQRQHRRGSHADADLQQTLRQWHTGEQAPAVRHLLALSPECRHKGP
ncbi:MFS transporter [Roseateles sp. DAIF2]|uniref:MFS transporter n=1 Tax=Roseateles sp. DAIF2 TaxID=2714952 RepID=UPI0018A2D64D|nr:MFS transporter [Roseateles sp. DAIF2]QPF74040.1 MFS transporter [Roseateles sp. DAIF2]